MNLSQARDILASAKSQEFILKHLKSDIKTLLLKYHQDEEKRFLLEQIAARQKIRKKLPAWYQNPQLIFPLSANLEQSSSAQTAALKSRFFSGQSFTDLSGGFGVDFYHLAQHFEQRTYVEPNAELFELATYNFKVLNFNCHCLNLSAEEALPQLEKQDLIYLDPSRRSEEKQRLINLNQYAPNALELQEALMAKAKSVLIKTSPMYSISEGSRAFEKLREIWVISLRNDCKELLFLLANDHAQQVPVKTWNLSLYEEQFFSNTLEASHGKIDFSEPLAYLYEPNASILKAGLAEAAALEFQLYKLHHNSQVYTSGRLAEPYPGKIFALKVIHKPFTKSLQKRRFNVISRNFPQKASIIEAKLQLKPAKTDYLIATSTQTRKVFLEAILIKA